MMRGIWLAFALLVGAVAGSNITTNGETDRITPMRVTMPLSETWSSRVRQTQRIVGGELAMDGQFPHQALLIMDNEFQCSGSLISTTAILTAGHCVKGFKLWSIYLGTLRRPEHYENSVIETHSMKLHPQFNTTGLLNNDVGIIFLREAVTLTPNIKLVHLPSGWEIFDTYVGKSAIASGWGLTSDSKTRAKYLRWIQLDIIPNKICKQYYKAGIIIESMLCAKGYRKNICRGDSGGPLALRYKYGYKLIGVSSFVSNKGCEDLVPAGFVRVSSFLPWITKSLRNHAG